MANKETHYLSYDREEDIYELVCGENVNYIPAQGYSHKKNKVTCNRCLEIIDMILSWEKNNGE